MRLNFLIWLQINALILILLIVMSCSMHITYILIITFILFI
uniref:Uncharacterized protein n=1 Tax=Osmundaria fimbriata TaxID=228265 RepID=A0A1Z1M4I7_OSMFI|nr:hypothetical protein [Osmundaria fimbriata]ARW60926.1 hypothetical protein [Osmundaria fimbriata]